MRDINNVDLKMIEILPNIDVEMPHILLKEERANIHACGVVYDLQLRSFDFDREMTTTLTVEELMTLRNAINTFLSFREKDPNRQGKDGI